jgi:hypothetical protein
LEFHLGLQTHVIANMFILGFFFLLCPGEYAQTTNPDSSPFQLCDLHLMVTLAVYIISHAPTKNLMPSTLLGRNSPDRKMEFAVKSSASAGPVAHPFALSLP